MSWDHASSLKKIVSLRSKKKIYAVFKLYNTSWEVPLFGLQVWPFSGVVHRAEEKEKLVCGVSQVRAHQVLLPCCHFSPGSCSLAV